ncbi:MAG: GDYXXLXY domain-containing protein [bacterium]|nr:GDYXXLXY domain-containing protein [bacterium]
MKKFPTLAFVIVILCQVLVLGGMIARRVHLLETGDVVLLQCRPVDPRSLFSGDYVVLSYTISRFMEEQFRQLNQDSKEFKRHDTIYVALSKGLDGKHWDAVAVSQDRKKLRADYPVVIRGVIQSTWQPHQVRYGVESYFVPQFEGKRIEREISNVSVEVAVAKSGESGIKRLFIDEQEVAFY